jgi:hypothetical protein
MQNHNTYEKKIYIFIYIYARILDEKSSNWQSIPSWSAPRNEACRGTILLCSTRHHFSRRRVFLPFGAHGSDLLAHVDAFNVATPHRFLQEKINKYKFSIRVSELPLFF